MSGGLSELTGEWVSLQHFSFLVTIATQYRLHDKNHYQSILYDSFRVGENETKILEVNQNMVGAIPDVRYYERSIEGRWRNMLVMLTEVWMCVLESFSISLQLLKPEGT